jgi:hypothetical protein
LRLKLSAKIRKNRRDAEAQETKIDSLLAVADDLQTNRRLKPSVKKVWCSRRVYLSVDNKTND